MSQIGVKIPKASAKKVKKRDDGGDLFGKEVWGWDSNWEVLGGSEREIPGEVETFPAYGEFESYFCFDSCEE
jgi:hypothetical protein